MTELFQGADLVMQKSLIPLPLVEFGPKIPEYFRQIVCKHF